MRVMFLCPQEFVVALCSITVQIWLLVFHCLVTPILIIILPHLFWYNEEKYCKNLHVGHT